MDTATVYNNLGCCMFYLKRIKESYSYYKLAQAIMEAELGVFHFRTHTVLIYLILIIIKGFFLIDCKKFAEMPETIHGICASL